MSTLRKIRALVVDDSSVMRRLVTEALAADPAIEVCGTAPNGRIGLDRIDSLHPDVVVLDMDMPEMNGLETLAAIRDRHARVRVIMFSSLTRKGAEATLEALALGAR